MGLGRDVSQLEKLGQRLRDAVAAGASPLDYIELLVNDLEPAAQALRPRIGDSLEALRAAGAARALISGSGPTAFGLFADTESAEAAASELGPAAIVCTPGAP
jgi:4-diphosphocytidyl-2-C-methyl-D-erythritol kinase